MDNQTIAVSAVMIAKDAARTITSALESVRFCDEVIVVLDAASTDETEAIARRLAGRVEVRPWEGFGPAKRYAAGLARGRWIVSIDADEVISPELASSIRSVAAGESVASAYQMRRRTRFLGRWIRHGDWGRDRVLRLFQRNQAEFTNAVLHESVRAPGPKPILSGWLWHEGDATPEAYLERMNRYTTLSAQQMFESGRRTGAIRMVARPFFEFVRAYVFRLGFLDGWEGLALAWYSSVYVFTRYAKLRMLQRGSARS